MVRQWRAAGRPLHCCLFFDGASCCAEFCVGDNSQFPIPVRCNAFASTPELSSSHTRRSLIVVVVVVALHCPPRRPSPTPSPSRVFLFPPPTNMANGPPGSMSLPPADAQPSSDTSWEGDKMSVFLYLPLHLVPQLTLPYPIPGSTFTFTITATNVASAKPLASCSQKPIYLPTLHPPSTLNRVSCSSLSLSFFPRRTSLSTNPPGGGVSFGSFSPPRAMAQARRMLWSTPRYVSCPPTSSPPPTHRPPCQHQIQQANLRQGSRPLNHQLPQVNRMINGTQRPQALLQHDTQLPNGPGHSSALGNPAQMPFPMVGAGPQPNSIPIPSTGPNPAGPNPAPQQNFTALMPGQRPNPPQHRGPNGVNPYQSPTIAHSPQNQSGNAGPNQQNQMNQMGPSPRMAHMARGGMLPPNANMGSVPPTQTPPFSQFARSPSRPGTPGQGMQPSPSLMDRQTPVNPHEGSLNLELSRLPTNILTSIRQELGLHDKELQSLTFDEKVISFPFEALVPLLT